MLFYRMRRTIRGVFSLTSIWLTLSALLCVIFIIFNALVWDSMPEPFNGATVLSSAAIDLLLAYVAGYIFYVLTNVYPEYKKQQFIYFTIMRHELMGIAKSYSYLLSDLVLNGKHIDIFDAFEVFGSPEGQPLLVQSTTKLSVDDASRAHNKTWLEHLTGVCHAENHAIEKMLRFDLNLELDIQLLLINILHSDYKQMIEVMNKSNSNNQNRSFNQIIYMLHSHLGLLLILQNKILTVISGKRL